MGTYSVNYKVFLSPNVKLHKKGDRTMSKHDTEQTVLPTETHEVELPAAAKNKRKRNKATHGKGRKTSKVIKRITKKFPKAPSDVRSNSEAVRESWTNKKVAAARAARHGVRVAGEEYKSVREAFAKLKLPMSKHITFRAKVKAEGKATFEHDDKKFNFVLVEPKEETK